MTLLSARGIAKSFEGVHALRGVDLDLEQGQVMALVGENGAGKSTFIKVACGLHPHGSFGGLITLDGAPCRFRGPSDAIEVGISTIHQELALVPDLSVAENIHLGRFPLRWGLVDREACRRQAREVLERLGIGLDVDVPVGRLSVGERQLVEIARALLTRSRVLILDEPTAALTEADAARLLGLVRDLAAAGAAVLYVSHRLDEVFSLCRTIQVLRDGEAVGGPLATAETSPPEVISRMVGRPVQELYPRPASSFGDVVLSIDEVTVPPKVGPRPLLDRVTLSVRAGEVMGLAGLLGAGRTLLLSVLAGLYEGPLSGGLRLAGASYRPVSPAGAVRRGVVYVPEDRKARGIIPDMTVAFNLTLSVLRSLTVIGLLSRRLEDDLVGRLMGDVAVRGMPTQPVKTLSGGNQQKVVVGRQVSTRPRLLLLDEPTRGVDIGARAEIYALVRRLTAEGLAVVVASSEIDEVLGLADRVAVISRGRVSGPFARGELDRERAMALMTGVSSPS